MTVWSEAEHCYLEVEVFLVTGPHATHTLLHGDGRQQAFGDVASAYAPEFPVTTGANKSARVRIACPTCPGMMARTSTQCMACMRHVIEARRALPKSPKPDRYCVCKRLIAKSSTRDRCVRCIEQQRRLKR